MIVYENGVIQGRVCRCGLPAVSMWSTSIGAGGSCPVEIYECSDHAFARANPDRAKELALLRRMEERLRATMLVAVDGLTRAAAGGAAVQNLIDALAAVDAWRKGQR